MSPRQPNPGAEELAQLQEGFASVADALSELIAGLASEQTPSKGWAYTAIESLAGHMRAMGMEPSLDVSAIPDWKDVE